MAWVTPKQFAARTGIPLKTVYRWVEHGALPYLRLPGSRRIQIDFEAVVTRMHLQTKDVPDNVVSLDARRRSA